MLYFKQLYCLKHGFLDHGLFFAFSWLSKLIPASKADIFEARVASAVDEADSSDSDETFVYESNPPEPLSARPNRFHSRTPSTASTYSLLDPHGLKGRSDGHHSLVSKKSMKFATNYNSINQSNDNEGTVRGPSQHARGSTTPHHQHVSVNRFGRSGHHPSLFDSNSPFEATHSPRSAKAYSQPHSPHHSSSQVSLKQQDYLNYDLDCEAADDERALLLGPSRSARGRRRPLPGSVRHTYANAEYVTHPYWTRTTAWISLSGALFLLLAAIIIILVLCTKPLTDLEVRDIGNVLASESELMMDLHVEAINPNLVAIQISDLDLNLFAKSRHVGSSVYPHQRRAWPFPPHGISQDAQTMLLGRVTAFDSPLIFEPSPLYHYAKPSTGLLRLSRPGNRTEEGGSLRWEHVVLYDFELIIRGVVKYSLPLSGRMRSASIGARTTVRPSDNDADSVGDSFPRGQSFLP